jgi:predicted transcriptional regulator
MCKSLVLFRIAHIDVMLKYKQNTKETQRRHDMANVKEVMTKIIQEQPEDASYEEIMRELAFERMVERGLEDSRKGRMISDEEMEHRIRSWQG